MKKSKVISSIALSLSHLFAAQNDDPGYISMPSILTATGSIFGTRTSGDAWIICYGLSGSVDVSQSYRYGIFINGSIFYGSKPTFDFDESYNKAFNTQPNSAGKYGADPYADPFLSNSLKATPPGTIVVVSTNAGALHKNTTIGSGTFTLESATAVPTKDITCNSDDVFVVIHDRNGLKCKGYKILFEGYKAIEDDNDCDKEHYVHASYPTNIGIILGFMGEQYEPYTFDYPEETGQRLWIKTTTWDFVLGLRLCGSIDMLSSHVMPSLTFMLQLYGTSDIEGTSIGIYIPSGTPIDDIAKFGDPANAATKPIWKNKDDLNMEYRSAKLKRNMQPIVMADAKILLDIATNIYLCITPFFEINVRSISDDNEYDATSYANDRTGSILENTVKAGIELGLAYIS